MSNVGGLLRHYLELALSGAVVVPASDMRAELEELATALDRLPELERQYEALRRRCETIEEHLNTITKYLELQARKNE